MIGFAVFLIPLSRGGCDADSCVPDSRLPRQFSPKTTPESLYMAIATWNGVTLAESDATVVVEGNHYFPPDALHRHHLATSDHKTICPWKGEASYFHVEAGGDVNENAAWTYPSPKPAASEIKDHVAFWKGVEVTA